MIRITGSWSFGSNLRKDHDPWSPSCEKLANFGGFEVLFLTISIFSCIFHSWEIMDHDLFLDLSQKIMIPWSGLWKSHDPDQKLANFFLIRIKNWPIFFDPDQKFADFFLIRIKNWPIFFWSGSKKMHDFFWSGS